MTARVVRFVFETRSCAVVSGYGSRELITELRGRPPVWSTLSRGWVVQPQTARDLIAICEARGYDVVLEGGGADELA